MIGWTEGAEMTTKIHYKIEKEQVVKSQFSNL